MPVASEDEIGWRLIKEVSARGAELLMPVFGEHKGKNGRLAIQTDPRFYRHADAIVEQAIDSSQLRPNMIVKIPVTDAGVQAVEEAAFHGVSILATVCLLLSAAFRNHMHWSEFIGGDVIISPPHKWQLRFNASDIEVIPRIDSPVEPKIVEELLRKLTDFRRAYAEDGLKSTEFDSFGSTARTLRQFIAACADLSSMIRDFMMPDPDI